MTLTAKDIYEANLMELAKALNVRGDKSIYTYIQIPEDAKGPTGEELKYTHVKVYTMKHGRKYVSCDCRAVEVTEVSERMMLFGPDKYGTELCREENVRATDRTLLRVHTAGLTAILTRFPELFAAPGGAESPTQGAESAPEASEDRVERGEADATGVDDEEDASTGRWAPPTMRTTVLSSANVRGLFTMLAVALGLGAFAQNVTRDAQGNFHSNRIVEAAHDSTTGYTYTYQHGPKEYTLPVFVTAKGAYYAWRLSGKTGKQYRYYLRTEAKQ